MCKTNNIIKRRVNAFISWMLIITGYLMLLSQANAIENITHTTLLQSVSKGSFKHKLNNEQPNKTVETTQTIVQLDKNHESKNRVEILKNQKNSKLKSEKGLSFQKNFNHSHADFEIYSATSFLIEDYDNDSFYQTFSVVFDADIYSYTENNTREVYASMYLSKNGNPWKHYYTTEIFIIKGDSEHDEYEVNTTFISGYSTNHYDVLIDLYQVGYNEVVATYSSDDSNDLYALPLESANYDEPYVEVIEVYGGGFSFVILFIIFICLVLRYRLTKYNKQA